MLYLHESIQAVVMIVCEKHTPALLEKLDQSTEGNWFVLPSIAHARMGYWPHVSNAHPGKGCALFGFAERSALTLCLEAFASRNDDGSLCPDCAAYEWSIVPSHAISAVRDPVCGKTISSIEALSDERDGELFFFCSVGCRDKFHEHPEKYGKNSVLPEHVV